MVFVFPLSAKLILMERNSLLPSIPARGHGLVLLIFWILVFFSENVVFITIKNKDWWLLLHTSVNFYAYKFIFNYIHIIKVINFQHERSNSIWHFCRELYFKFLTIDLRIESTRNNDCKRLL